MDVVVNEPNEQRARRLFIEPTDRYYQTSNVTLRLWRGTDQSGRPVSALLAAVVHLDHSPASSSALSPVPPPSTEEQIRQADDFMRELCGEVADERRQSWASKILSRLRR